MSTFWILALLLSLLATAFVWFPVYRAGAARETPAENRTRANVDIYRDQLTELQKQRDEGLLAAEQFEQQKNELELELLAAAEAGPEVPAKSSSGGRAVALAMAAGVPVLAFVLYADWGLSLGAIADLEVAQDLETVSQGQGGAPHDANQMDQVVVKLKERLAKQPDNDEGWFLLARSLTSMGEYQQALEAYDHLLARYPADAKLKSYKAEMLYLLDGRVVTERVRKLVDEVLAVEPELGNMLEMLGMDAFTRGDFKTSIAYFERVLAQGVEGEHAAQINEVVQRARELMGEAGTEAAPPALAAGATPPGPDTAPAAAGSGAALDVLVELAPGLKPDPAYSVFVFARAVAGPPMPLAVSRMTVADLPKLVRLDDSMSMMNGVNLTTAKQVHLVARISPSGKPVAQPGDWEAVSDAIDVAGAGSVTKLVIANQIQ